MDIRLSGNKLRSLRESRDLSREKVTRAAGLSAMTLQRLELQRDSDPKLSTLCALADAYDMSVCEFLNRTLDSIEAQAA